MFTPYGRLQHQRKPYGVTQDIVAWVNTIIHNLSLSDPMGFQISILYPIPDGTYDTRTIDHYTAFDANSFSWISPISVSGVHFTIS